MCIMQDQFVWEYPSRYGDIFVSLSLYTFTINCVTTGAQKAY